MSCCVTFTFTYNRRGGTGERRMGGRCKNTSEKTKFSPDSNRINFFIHIPCKFIILSWIVEVVEWIDGAGVFFAGPEDSPASPSSGIAAESLESAFEGS